MAPSLVWTSLTRSVSAPSKQNSNNEHAFWYEIGGGQSFVGSKLCAPGWTCVVQNTFFSTCSADPVPVLEKSPTPELASPGGFCKSLQNAVLKVDMILRTSNRRWISLCARYAHWMCAGLQVYWPRHLWLLCLSSGRQARYYHKCCCHYHKCRCHHYLTRNHIAHDNKVRYDQDNNYEERQTNSPTTTSSMNAKVISYFNIVRRNIRVSGMGSFSYKILTSRDCLCSPWKNPQLCYRYSLYEILKCDFVTRHHDRIKEYSKMI